MNTTTSRARSPDTSARVSLNSAAISGGVPFATVEEAGGFACAARLMGESCNKEVARRRERSMGSDWFKGRFVNMKGSHLPRLRTWYPRRLDCPHDRGACPTDGA